MSTGYTAPVRDGKVTELSEFAMQCARAFGALITMRDDPMDAPIRQLEPADYHRTAAVRAREQLYIFDQMTATDAQARAATEHCEAVQRRESYRIETAVRRARYDAMLTKVRAWDPPTAEHEGLKRFMVEQLEESICFDCDTELPEPEVKTGATWLIEAKQKAQRDVEYHEQQYAEDVARTNDRNEWVRKLRDSPTPGGDRAPCIGEP